MTMPPLLRDLGFAGIGISLGAGVEPGLVQHLGAWGASLVLLCASLVATLAVATAILRRAFGKDLATAVLASSPGTISYALAAAYEGKGDVIAVLVVQSFRLLLLASVLPLTIFLLAEPPGPAEPERSLEAFEIAPLLLATLAVGAFLGRAGLPAAQLVAGMTLSGLAHGFDLVSGPLPGWAIFLCFAITGSMIGTRFSGISGRAMASLVLAAAVTTSAAALVSAIFAVIAASLTGLPFGQVWVAFAPGGVEGMAAIGLALGYDPAYVAVHHLSRMIFLTAALPIILRHRKQRPKHTSHT
jgi:uncharacterized protein